MFAFTVQPENGESFHSLIPGKLLRDAAKSMSKSLVKAVSCVLLMFFSVATTLCAAASKSIDGTYPYNIVMIPTLVEGLKLASSGALLGVMYISGIPVTISWSSRGFASFASPAFCYFVSNNCMFHVIRLLGPTMFQILSNLKILSTALLMRIFLGRKVSWFRWKALAILALGSMVSQLSCEQVFERDSLLGYLFLLAHTMSSGAGGVLSEKLLKGGTTVSDTIHWQNVQLYSFGVLFGVASMALDGERSRIPSSNVFHGFNAAAVATVFSMTVSGLLVSFILKHLDNIAKCFVVTISMLVVALCNSLLTDTAPPLQLLIGMILCCIAIEQYQFSPQDGT